MCRGVARNFQKGGDGDKTPHWSDALGWPQARMNMARTEKSDLSDLLRPQWAPRTRGRLLVWDTADNRP